MAQQVGANIYGQQDNLWGQAYYRYFPTQGITMFPAPAGSQSIYGINLYGVIKLLTENGQPEYLTDKGTAQLATEANT